MNLEASLLKVWQIIGLAQVKIEIIGYRKVITFSSVSFLRSLLFFLLTAVGHGHYIWNHWNDFVSKRNNQFSKPLQVVPRLATSIFMLMTDSFFILSSKKLSVRLIERLPKIENITKELRTDNNKVCRFVLFGYCFFVFHVLFHLIASIILMGWQGLLSFYTIVMMYINDFVTIAGGMRWFYIIYIIKTKFEKLNEMIKLIVDSNRLYSKDYPTFTTKGNLL